MYFAIYICDLQTRNASLQDIVSIQLICHILKMYENPVETSFLSIVYTYKLVNVNIQIPPEKFYRYHHRVVFDSPRFHLLENLTLRKLEKF